MGHLGFSYVGAIYLLMLFVPNILWSRALPEGYSSQGESPVLLALERLGEIACSCVAVAFSDFNLRPWTGWCWWLAGSFGLMLLYEAWWVRYFRSPRRLEDFYSGFLGVPVAGATLPVGAFFLLGVYGRVVWMLGAAAVLGVGHIGIHWRHSKALAKK